jgi:hypothetical protein
MQRSPEAWENFSAGFWRKRLLRARRSLPQIKTNSSDTLTVDQLVRCLKKASALDEESEFIAAKRSELQSAGKDMDARKSKLEMKAHC